VEVQAEIGAEDYRAFLQHAARRAASNSRRPRFRLVVAAWAAFVVLFTWLYTATTWAPAYILAGGVGVAVGFLFFYWGNRAQRVDLSPAKDGIILGWRTYIVEKDGVRVNSETSQLSVSWKGVRAVEQTGEHIFIYIDRGTALIVPKRAFASVDDETRFVEALHQRQT